MRSLSAVNGFTLLEVIPSISLFAVFSTISLNVLLLVMQLQEKSDYEEYLGQAFLKVTETWSESNETIAICRLNDEREWEVVDIPNESWLPAKKHSGQWICWRKRSIKDKEIGIIGIEYLNAFTGKWIRWSSILDMEYENDEQS